MDEKGASRLSLPECTEDEEDHDDAPEPHNLEHVWDNLAPAVSAPNICVPALYEDNYL